MTATVVTINTIHMTVYIPQFNPYTSQQISTISSFHTRVASASTNMMLKFIALQVHVQ
jgi:hypothetical protein